MQQNVYYNSVDELDEELNIDLKKIFMTLWSRKDVMLKVFLTVLVFFIVLTFVLPKKYKVEADLYINKSNTTNLIDINPYAIEELGATGGMAALITKQIKQEFYFIYGQIHMQMETFHLLNVLILMAKFITHQWITYHQLNIKLFNNPTFSTKICKSKSSELATKL